MTGYIEIEEIDGDVTYIGCQFDAFYYYRHSGLRALRQHFC